MTRGTVYYDRRSGKLESGLVWSFDNDLQGIKGLVHATVADDDGGKESELEETYECPVNKAHLTEMRFVHIRMNLSVGKTLGDFIHLCETGGLFISESFARRLRETDLTGYAIKPIVKIVHNHSEVVNPRILHLEITGKGGYNNRRWQVKGAPNLCPHCKQVAMVCPGCGEFNWPKCAGCGKMTLYRPDEPEYSDPGGLAFELDVDGPAIVEGKDWDGSDWFDVVWGATCVSNKAKEWLERIHAVPIQFKRALLNIEGVEDKFKGKK